jgi:hypothetical protein
MSGETLVHALVARAHLLIFGVRGLLRSAALQTGVPPVLIAALTLVAAWWALKRTLRFAVQVALVTAALLVATEFGWLRW